MGKIQTLDAPTGYSIIDFSVFLQGDTQSSMVPVGVRSITSSTVEVQTGVSGVGRKVLYKLTLRINK